VRPKIAIHKACISILINEHGGGGEKGEGRERGKKTQEQSRRIARVFDATG